MNKAIVTGAPLRFDSGNVRMNSTKLKNGDKITLDANTGRVYSGHTKVTENKPGEELRMILNLADDLVSRGIIVSVPTPRDAKLVSTDYGVLFSPFGCLTPEQVDYLKGLIYGNNKGLNSFRRKLVRGYSEFIKSAGSDRVPLVLGVVSEENMDALTQNKVRLESRISLLERYARRLRVDDKKVLIGNVDVGLKGDRIVGAKIGDEAIYSNTRVKVDKICDDCGIRLKYSGGVFCLKRENLPSLKVIDPRAKKVEYVSPHARDIRMEIEVLESGLSRLSKADTHKVYEVQLEAAEEAVKSYRKRGINIADISFNQSSIRVDGKRYDLIPIKDLDRRRLERAQEVLNNGR
jgi:hypothetical protein